MENRSHFKELKINQIIKPVFSFNYETSNKRVLSFMGGTTKPILYSSIIKYSEAMDKLMVKKSMPRLKVKKINLKSVVFEILDPCYERIHRKDEAANNSKGKLMRAPFKINNTSPLYFPA